jgi:nitroreductase
MPRVHEALRSAMSDVSQTTAGAFRRAGTEATDHAAPVGLHPLLGGRFSPLSFDADFALFEKDVEVLLEAARWAPSAGNSQPWAFVAVLRGTADHARVVDRLAASSARWAPSASLLVVNIAHLTVGDSDIEYSEFADYDLGQAVAHLTLQAQALGLACRQFRAFDLDGLAHDLRIEPGWKIRTMTAVGQGTGQAPPRQRRPLSELRPSAVPHH